MVADNSRSDPGWIWALYISSSSKNVSLSLSLSLCVVGRLYTPLGEIEIENRELRV
uniref:Uncharacterized protein n=1 Tax=Manihot esculenta TaxID=3983 RepID=A0A199U9H9_MANES